MSEVWFALLALALAAFFAWGAWNKHKAEQEFKRLWAEVEKDLDG